MKNLVSSFNVLNNVMNGKIKFILSYGESKTDVVPMGLYTATREIELSGNKRCYKSVDEPVTYLLDESERGFDLADIKGIYEYLYGMDIDVVGLSKKYPDLAHFDVYDRMVFDGPAGKITIPIIKVIESFSSKNISENVDMVFRPYDPADSNLEFIVGNISNNLEEKDTCKGRIFHQPLNAFTSDELQAHGDDLKGTNYTIIPISEIIDSIDMRQEEERLQTAILESSKKKTEDTYQEYEVIEEQEARHKHGNNDEKYKDREKAIISYNKNRDNVAKKKQRKANKKGQA